MKHNANLRQKYIDAIIKNKSDDDPDSDSKNQAFLETLSLTELTRLAKGEGQFNDDINVENFETN